MPIQQFSNVKSHAPGETAGKNATDATLIIDAMDILYSGNVEGFVIVSSDSDFTRLAQRLREGGMIVVGMGRSHTSASFRQACTTFVNIENLLATEQGDPSSAFTANDQNSAEQAKIEAPSLSYVERIIAAIVRDNEGSGEHVPLSQVGIALRTRIPDFDMRAYGYTQPSRMIGDMPRFELKGSGASTSVVLANNESLNSEVRRFIQNTLRSQDGRQMLLSQLGQEVSKKYPRFNLKDTGYSQFWRFVESIKGIELVGSAHQRARLTKR